MDRTIIVPYRAEEKELSHILYNAIQGLIVLYPPTEDLRKCLSDEMFIKPNQQAFFHIMHYLFRIFDPQEFKKRFFWPITDKRSESNFRTSTVEYLKYINEKFQLNWTNIKSYLVVMPGGMKFISFLLDFVNFIVQELVKQKEKQLNLDANNYRPQVSEANLHKMCAKNEFFKGMASEFIDAIENLNTMYDDKSKKVMQHLQMLSQETGLSPDLLTDEKFLESFEKYNYNLFDQYYSDRSKKVLEMENIIGELKEAMDKFYSKETGYKYDKQRISLQLKRIRDHFPIAELVEDSFSSKITDEGVNINILISTFNAINETIQSDLKIFNKKPCAGELVYSRLLSLKTELQDMETQITSFKKMLHENMKKCKTEFPKTPIHGNVTGSTKHNLENTLLMKLVSTPPIKYEVPEGGSNSRLALVDSIAGNNIETATFNNFLAPPRVSTTRQQNRHHSLMDQTMTDLNNSMNRSKIINPLQLLRSTNKKDSSKYKTTTSQINISSLGAKWKLRQTILNDNDNETPSASATVPVAITAQTNFKLLDISKTSPQSHSNTASPTTLHQSPFTFSSIECTRIAKSQQQSDSYVTSDGNSSRSPLNYVKTCSAVKKVQDASSYFPNLSTSPSGRLEPLVTAEDLNMPKVKLNDISLFESDVTLNNAIVYENPKFFENSPGNNTKAYDENNPNLGNIGLKRAKGSSNKYSREEDALYNTSDSVLKDVTL